MANSIVAEDNKAKDLRGKRDEKITNCGIAVLLSG